MRTTLSKINITKGFTLVELLVSISIFAFTTAFVAVKYSTFSQGILLTNLAYDMALTIRQAQSYGISVKDSATFAGGNSDFTRAYGVQFSGETSRNKKFIFYVDKNNNGRYSEVDNDIAINTFKINKGNYIKKICVGNCDNSTDKTVSISFRRPDPSPVIMDLSGNPYTRAEIQLASPDGTETKIVVRSSGQISIE